MANQIMTAKSLRDEVLERLGQAMEEAMLDELTVTMSEGLPTYMVEVDLNDEYQ